MPLDVFTLYKMLLGDGKFQAAPVRCNSLSGFSSLAASVCKLLQAWPSHPRGVSMLTHSARPQLPGTVSTERVFKQLHGPVFPALEIFPQPLERAWRSLFFPCLCTKPFLTIPLFFFFFSLLSENSPYYFNLHHCL